MEKLQQWRRVKEIVASALERLPSERPAYLDEVCSQDSALRAEIESLLSAYRDSDDLSESPWPVESTGQEPGPKLIGPYCLLKELGIGGMGQVWLAQQTEPVRRQVALKLIKAGMYDASTVQRFKAERQSLAIMEHPAIAKVFDAGTTATGQPFLVMEYVDGLPITDYCDSKKLGIRERLQLFNRVCEGVQHAHQKAIIHRDLKPSNILVVDVDGKPMPRIIDFGLAKTAVPLVPGETLFTQMGAFLGTPGYMSPEQSDPDVHDIDTRTDVYSLGAILYELLTGYLPIDAAEWRKKRPEEVLRQLREEDPPRPSTKVSINRDNSTSKSQARNTEPKQLVALLRGDLDWIVMKALEKDREQRYATPSALVTDIENYLSSRPVTARAANLRYRLRKYVLRHAVGVAVVSGILALLVAFAATQAVELRRITRERDRADRITEFMTNMFKVSDPSEARGNTITAREILDKSSQEINTGLANDPELQVRLLDAMGHVYVNLGLYLKAQETFERALTLAPRVGGTRNPAILSSMSRLSFLLIKRGKFKEAESMLREAVDGQRRIFGPNNGATLSSSRYLSFALESEGRYKDAENTLTATLAAERRYLGPEAPETLLSMNLLANILDDEGRQSEAEKLYRETLEIQTRTLGPDYYQTLTTASNLAAVLQEESHLADAEKLQREILATRTRVLGADHPDTLAVKLNLANTLDSGTRYAEAEQLYLETLQAQRRVLGAEHPETLTTMHSLGNTLRREGRTDDAEKLQRETLAVRRRVIGPDHPETLRTMGELAATLFLQHKDTEAHQLYATRLEAIGRTQGKDSLAEAWYDYACAAAVAEQLDEAIDHLRQAVTLGFSDSEHMSSDQDLKSLHGDPRFEQLVLDARQRATAAALRK
jgi:eukaryotic-like serine/threonine-protein kinase